MEPSGEVPGRSNLWFSEKIQSQRVGRLFDPITVVLITGLGLLAPVTFWPIISQIDFEEVFFTPLAPFLMALVGLLGFSANEAIRVLFITSFVVSILGVYLSVLDLTKRQMTAILAAAIYIIPPVPVFVLTYLSRGLYEVELESAKSFLTVVYGDGANFLALALIPFVGIFLLRFLKWGRKIDFFAATLTCCLILLASRSATLSLLLILCVFALSEFFLGFARIKIRRFLLVIIFSLGLVAFWYNFAFWGETFSIFNLKVLANIKFLFPLPFTLGLLALLFSFVFFAKNEERQPIFVSFLLFIVFLSITGDWLVNQRSFMPHPQRLFPYLNMFGAIVFGLLITAIIDRLRLAEIVSFEKWSVRLRVWGALVFGAMSFGILTLIAFLISPLAILAVSGPLGLWSRVRNPVFAEKQEALEAVGENFKLVWVEASAGERWLGIGITVIFLAALVLIVFRELLGEEN